MIYVLFNHATLLLSELIVRSATLVTFARLLKIILSFQTQYSFPKRDSAAKHAGWSLREEGLEPVCRRTLVGR
jgi:hypothetical protein